jgi:uncharacterized membrane protein
MIQYLLTAIVFVVLDGFYLNLVKDYFNKQIKSIQGSTIQIRLIATAITYVFLIFGVNYFIIQKHRPVKDAALLGLTIYGVYEFTNYSLLKDWSLLTVIMDTTWGTVLFALTTAIVYSLTPFTRK